MALKGHKLSLRKQMLLHRRFCSYSSDTAQQQQQRWQKHWNHSHSHSVSYCLGKLLGVCASVCVCECVHTLGENHCRMF